VGGVRLNPQNRFRAPQLAVVRRSLRRLADPHVAGRLVDPHVVVRVAHSLREPARSTTARSSGSLLPGSLTKGWA